MTNVISMSEWRARKVIRRPTAPIESQERVDYISCVGSSDGYLEILPIKSRRKCHCCGQRNTHSVSNNGIALASGCLSRCEAYIKRAIQRSICKAEMEKQRDSEI